MWFESKPFELYFIPMLNIYNVLKFEKKKKEFDSILVIGSQAGHTCELIRST